MTEIEIILTALARTGAIAIMLSILYLMFVIIPVSMYTEAECLRAGFPKAYVTIGLERYCATLDGPVTVRVEKK